MISALGLNGSNLGPIDYKCVDRLFCLGLSEVLS